MLASRGGLPQIEEENYEKWTMSWVLAGSSSLFHVGRWQNLEQIETALP